MTANYCEVLGLDILVGKFYFCRFAFATLHFIFATLVLGNALVLPSVEQTKNQKNEKLYFSFARFALFYDLAKAKCHNLEWQK
jgi:hypothetical protein